jgi:endoribonuclease Dicer
LTALQNDERANYQVDVKFQESYLKKVVDLLHCQLTEGAAMRSETNDVEMRNAENDNPSELEDGELPDSHGICFTKHDMQSFFFTFPYPVSLI